MPQVVYLTLDDRRALLNALKPGLMWTRATSEPGAFSIAGVNIEFRVQPPTKETE